ncbi:MULTISPECIES: type VI secretion system tip protein VgrG [unclassified Caballeronia]|uniref:type VI secretion system tip protein VgrG n=1 Tax=unclassified Caballeronia TaxID=2646786 RepID=UPI00286500B5|nr:MULTISPECIES: type VI secretion system tip protein VgrG [unclassified Caballeronia]MDR5750381.1 type VI secretion system tip protein VgrG [Caballeronia sp. LZ024]MDR5842586.1 type VI secretion system tip protein VgrG [Caballeronia sp. LZ031]
MNAVTKSFTDALRHPSARLTQHLKIRIGAQDLDLDVLDFKVRGGLCKDYKVDITVTSPRLVIDGKEYVGRRAGLHVDEQVAIPSASWSSPVDHSAATFNGVVTRWKRIRTSRDEAAYQVRIKPRFAALCKRIVKSDVLKDVTFEEMVRQLMIDGQNFDAFDIEFHLEGPQDKMEQVVMYEESVWNMVTRHAKRKGIFWFYRQERGENGLLDILVFANNPRAYIRSVNLPLFADSGLHSNWHEAAQAVHEQRTLVPATVELWERNYRTPEEPLQATSNVSAEDGDRSVFGRISRSAEFHLTPAQGEALAQTRRDEQIARQVTFAGKTDAKGIAPGVVVKLTNTTMPNAEYGFVVTSFRMEGSRTKPAYTRFKAMPAHLTYRPDFDYERDWRFLNSVVGVVTTLDSAPYAYLDEHGRYPVLPKFLQGTGNADNKLLNLRLLRSSSSDQGGFHSPLLPKTEVMLEAAHGDVDRLHISGALHDFAHQDPVRGTDALFSYAIWRSPLLGAEVVFNDLQGKESARISTVYSQTAVNQGYLLNSKKLPRGTGYEATTQAWGTFRAAKGLFFSADAAAGADTPHLEMPAAVAQLKAALQRVTDLAAATTQAKAEPADRATQAALLDGLNQLRDAGLLASAPGGMAFVTPKSAQHSAGENVIVTAGRDMDVSITRRLRMVAGDLFSLCAHKLGINLTAAKGKFTASALTDGMDLFAQQQLRVASQSADVQVAAKSKITLNSGGASLVIENGNMTFHCPGAFTIKAASFSFQGPDGTPTPLPSLPKSSLKISDQYSSSH